MKTYDAYHAFMDMVAPLEGNNTWFSWSFISTAAAILERRIWIKRGGAGYRYPNLYTVLCGYPGSGKGFHSDVPFRILQDYNKSLGDKSLGIRIGSHKNTSAALFEDLKKATKTNSGIPGIGNLTHSSVFANASELEVLLQDLGDGGIAPDLLKLYDCEDTYTKSLVKFGGEVTVEGPCVNLMAATTPTFLHRQLDVSKIGTGLLSRFIMVYSPEVVRRKPTIPEFDRDLYNLVLAHFRRMHIMGGEMTHEQAGFDHWLNWFNAQQDRLEMLHKESFEYCLETRFDVHVQKVAMILSACRNSSRIIEPCDYDLAIKLITDATNKVHQLKRETTMTENNNTLGLVVGLFKPGSLMTHGEIRLILWYTYTIKAENKDLDSLLQMATELGLLKCVVTNGEVFYTRV